MAMAAFTLIACGCHKAGSTATSMSPTPSTAPANSTQPAQSAANTADSSQSQLTPAQKAVAATPTTTPDGQPDLAVLNRSLLRWVMGNRRSPANFADFAATAGVPIPPPPSGKKYIINKSMHIQLVAE